MRTIDRALFDWIPIKQFIEFDHRQFRLTFELQDCRHFWPRRKDYAALNLLFQFNFPFVFDVPRASRMKCPLVFSVPVFSRLISQSPNQLFSGHLHSVS